MLRGEETTSFVTIAGKDLIRILILWPALFQESFVPKLQFNDDWSYLSDYKDETILLNYLLFFKMVVNNQNKVFSAI